MMKYFKKKAKFGPDRDIELHEILLDRLAKKKEKELGISEKKIEVPLLKKVFQRFLFCSFLIMFVLFLRTFQLQVVEGETLSAQAYNNRYIFYKMQAERGIIYDNSLEQLVFNIPSFDLICEKDNLPESETERKEVLEEVADILGIEYQELVDKIEGSEDSIISVSDNLEHQPLIVLETKIDELFGFKINQRLIRDYKEGDAFSHLIGYTARIKKEELKENPRLYSILDYVGRVGIEKSYEEFLRKNPGEIRIERNALGNIISKEVISLPESGNNLVLWIDADLQRKAKEELENQLQSIGSKKGIIVAMDPKTGGILSLVSIPSFDNNVFSKADEEVLEEIFNDKDEPLFNRVISGIGYSTGSTIKPLIASAALQEETVSPDKYINCQGFIQVEHQYDPDIIYTYHDWRAHGYTNMRKALAESCNSYFYSLGGGYEDFGIKGLGPYRIKEYLQLFGWGEKTNIDLPNEGSGMLPTIDKNWRLGNTYHFSIGQGPFAITPIQVVTAFSSIANGGKLIQPKIVQSIIDQNKNIVKEIKPEIIRTNFIDAENLQVVREGMREAVTGKNAPLASAKVLNYLPVAAAAKTGTAETKTEGIYHNWVTVFAPYKDPEIVLTVMIEDVEGVHSPVAPIAREILNWYFTK